MKEKKECYLDNSKENLTIHHIYPKRKCTNNSNWNLIVLCRKCHNIIDCKKSMRTKEFYEEHKKIIRKYNKYLRDRDFPPELHWIIRVHKQNPPRKRSRKCDRRIGWSKKR